MAFAFHGTTQKRLIQTDLQDCRPDNNITCVTLCDSAAVTTSINFNDNWKVERQSLAYEKYGLCKNLTKNLEWAH